MKYLKIYISYYQKIENFIYLISSYGRKVIIKTIIL